MSHASMLKTRRMMQSVKKQLRRAQKQARRDCYAGNAAPSELQLS